MLYILGGDSRIGFMAEKLQRDGYSVGGLGLSTEAVPEIPPEEGLGKAEAIILGIPASRDGETVFAPFYNGLIPLGSIPKYARPAVPVLCGLPKAAMCDLFSSHGLPVIDYFDREELALLNAVPTAEGALEIAMREMPITLWNARALVVGFGRCGQYLARLLAALGAHVTVSVRRNASAALAKTQGFSVIETREIIQKAGAFDVIFNTVPSKVLDAPTLSRLSRGCLVIDLASAPGGVDMEAAKAFGVNTIWALSLPGKVAPVTAGEILCDTIKSILSERN